MAQLAKWGILALGCAFLIGILSRTDFSAVRVEMQSVGLGGALFVLALSCVWPVIDVSVWSVTLPARPHGRHWVLDLFRIHLYGEALNALTPGVPLGGEPMKVMLLKERHGVPKRETTASLVLLQSIIVCALLTFVAIGVALMFASGVLPDAYRETAVVSLVLAGIGVAGLALAQRYRIVSRVGGWFGRRFGRGQEGSGLGVVTDIESSVLRFYRERPVAFVACVALHVLIAAVSAAEIFLVLKLIGNPVAYYEAWIIEAAVILLRNVFFLIPSGLGVQEGAFLAMCGLVTGSPTAGVTVALIRRAREVLWIIVGLSFGCYVTDSVFWSRRN